MALASRDFLLSICCTILILVATLVSSQDTGGSNPCIAHKTCGTCIAAGPACGWCLQEGYDTNSRYRCNLLERLMEGTDSCDYNNVVKPENSGQLTKNLPPQNAEDGADAIQLTPQEMELEIRPKSPFTFNVSFRQAENYPVDLYYIMDLSNSMADDKDKVAELGDLLAEEMVKITKNFRLGFGSFIDKKTMPYVNTVPSSLISPCDGCVAPYGFKNQLSLTDDTSQFRSRVLGAAISGNLDSPEGGFDAMMQAVTCQNDIGWRGFSRRMLLFSTDANFHSAGDGKLGGIVKPNDGHCHLDSTGYYSESLNQDYPSISQISNKVSENNVNVIFAVTVDRVATYRKLAEFIDGSVVGELANDSSNIVRLVKTNYEDISGIVELKAEAPEGVRVHFTALCANGTSGATGRCDKVAIGETVRYSVSIEVDQCPAGQESWSPVVEIYPAGLAEKLVVNLNMICQCDCELPENGVPNSPLCNGSGTYECGACSCNPGLYGKNCECDGTGVNTQDYDALCKMTNTTDEVCSGQGDCECGICVCAPVSTAANADPSQRFGGQFCECNDYSCDYYDGHLCGGPTRGTCKCGQCVCQHDPRTAQPLYTSDDCSCPTSQDTCKAPNGKICNDKGDCICGQCDCLQGNYYGPTCSDCPTCPGQCEQNKDCVQCTAFSSGKYTEQENWEEHCKSNCSHVTVVDKVQSKPGWKECQFRDDSDGCVFYFIYQINDNEVQAQSEKDEDRGWRQCRFRDVDNCFFYFAYSYDENGDPIVEVEQEKGCRQCRFRDVDNCFFYFAYSYDGNGDLIVEVEREKECPIKVNWWWILLGLILLVVLIGLILICCCIIAVRLYDRREYARFEKELEKAKWDMAENPIFKPATSTYTNPMK